MTAPTTRRAALGFLARAGAQVSALAAVPVVAMAALPAAGDAALLAMQSAIDAADRQVDAALDAADDAYSEKEPPRPAQPATAFTPEERQAVDAMGAVLQQRKTPLPEWEAYYQATRDWEREKERLEAECGVTAAHEREEAAHEAFAQVRDDLAETPATTLAGLIFKARYAASHYRTEYDEDVMISIVDDLLAMAEDGTIG